MIPSPGAATPGTLSVLLRELARAPEGEPGQWEAVLRPGAVVGRFELLRELGRGGFGVVFEARDLALGRLVAFKAIRPGNRAAEGQRRESLQREAEATAQLAHENIVRLYDAGSFDGGPYLVFELLDGETLHARLERGPLEPTEALRAAVEVARALVHAHGAGVLHRDLKPSNVLLTAGGRVKVLDFGLAQLFGTTTSSGGTPAYMAPEQWRAEPEDARTDVFAAAAILFESLAGRPPYAARDGRSEVLDPGRAPPPLPAGVPRRMSALVSRGLSRDPAGRPASAGAWLEGLLEAERAAAGGARAGAPPRRRRALAAVAALALAAVALVAQRLRPAPEPPDRIRVAIADLANETGDRDLDGLSGLLLTSLEQSHRLAVLTRARLLELAREAGRPAPERIDEPLARELGRRAGVRALVLASARRFGDLYVVEARALDPEQDAYLLTVKEEARTKSELPSAIDRLSERVRQGLRETAADIRGSRVSVAEVTTPDLEAYRYYFRGAACLESAAPAACIPELERAVSLDPGFALAHLELALARWWTERPGARDAIRTALRHVERAPARQQLQIRAVAAQMEGREDEAAPLFHEAVGASPDDRALVAKAADFFVTRNDLDAALPYLERWVALDPDVQTGGAWYLAQALGALGRAAALAELARRLEAAGPQPWALAAISAARGWLGDGRAAIDAARREVEVAPPSHRSLARLHLLWARSVFDEPALGTELEALDRASAGAVPDSHERTALARHRALHGRLGAAMSGLRGEEYGYALELHAARGDAAGAWAEAEEALRGDPVISASLAVHLAYLGDLEHAAVLAAGLAPGSPREQVYRAVVAWRRGEREAALAALEALAARNPWSSNPPVLPPSFLAGELAFELGEDARAVAMLQRFQALYSPWEPYRCWTYPRSLFFSARALERLGRRDEAREHAGALLALWQGADPDLRYLAEARALGARLGDR